MSWSAVMSLRGSRPSAWNVRHPSCSTMRGARSRYSTSTRSAYSSIGSVTCESVEMQVTPRYVPVTVLVMTQSLLGCARLGARAVRGIEPRAEVEESQALGPGPECVHRAAGDVHRATRTHDLASRVELALDHEDDLVLVVRVGVEGGVRRRLDLEHLEPVVGAGMVRAHLTVELAGCEFHGHLAGDEVADPPERLHLGTAELDPRHRVLLPPLAVHRTVLCSSARGRIPGLPGAPPRHAAHRRRRRRADGDAAVRAAGP